MTPVSYIQPASRIWRFQPTIIGSSMLSAAAENSTPTLNFVGTAPAEIAQRFVAARRSASQLLEYPGIVPATLAAAYACQELAIEQWPDDVAGWKVARIAPELVEKYGEPRLTGPVFRRHVHVVDANQVPQCPIFADALAAVETEIVIRVGRDAPADKTQWTIDESLDYIGDLHAGIEVASSPLATLNELGPAAVISDFGNNWGVVVGTAISNWRSRAQIDCETYIDDVLVGQRAVTIETGPLDAFAFTLGKCAARGRPLRAGAWITTGMITGVHDVRAGQVSRHVVGNYQVSCRAVRAVPV
jgi:2-keto-4-pentenoate hydratase